MYECLVVQCVSSLLISVHSIGKAGVYSSREQFVEASEHRTRETPQISNGGTSYGKRLPEDTQLPTN